MDAPPSLGGDVQPRPAHWFSIPRDIIFAPQRAFATIEEHPTWLPAFAIVALCSIAYLLLGAGGLAHVLRIQAALAPETRGLSSAELTRGIQASLELIGIQSVVWPLLVWVNGAAVFTLLGRKSPRRMFSIFFSLCANASIPSALGGLLAGLAVHAHDPQSFHSMAQLDRALPDNLALFTLSGSPAELDFLSQFDVFTLWSTILIGYGVAKIAELPLWVALSVAFGFQILASLVVVSLGGF